jgi:hypothetical protein
MACSAYIGDSGGSQDVPEPSPGAEGCAVDACTCVGGAGACCARAKDGSERTNRHDEKNLVKDESPEKMTAVRLGRAAVNHRVEKRSDPELLNEWVVGRGARQPINRANAGRNF